MPNAQEVLDWIKWDKERKANMTNEEWFCGLSTEEKAIFITMFALRRKFVNKGAFYESVKNSLINASELPKMPINLRRSVEEWLKEKHDGNS